MLRTLGFLGLLIVLAIGAYLYSRQLQATSTGDNVRATVDVAGVKKDLLSIAGAERRRFATEGRYATLDELISSGELAMPLRSRGPYVYESEVEENSFRITATYTGDPESAAPRVLSIDESMQVRTE